MKGKLLSLGAMLAGVSAITYATCAKETEFPLESAIFGDNSKTACDTDSAGRPLNIYYCVPDTLYTFRVHLDGTTLRTDAVEMLAKGQLFHGINAIPVSFRSANDSIQLTMEDHDILSARRAVADEFCRQQIRSGYRGMAPSPKAYKP